MRRVLAVAAVLAAILSMATGCSGQGGPSAVALTKEAADGGAGGASWSYPSRWTKQPPRMMRAATYTIPAANGDAEGGECAVFYFGTQQGGDVEGNIQRWTAQFENPSQPVRSMLTAGGIRITRVQIAGTYLAPAGPMMAASGKKERFTLLGAILEAPEGLVFFKLTGPTRTVDDTAKEFDAMLNSVVKK
jgi:hypothetical protein